MKCERGVMGISGGYYCTYHQLTIGHDNYGVVLKAAIVTEHNHEEIDICNNGGSPCPLHNDIINSHYICGCLEETIMRCKHFNHGHVCEKEHDIEKIAGKSYHRCPIHHEHKKHYLCGCLKPVEGTIKVDDTTKQTAIDILREGADTYEERHKVYGDNYKELGGVMKILFPDGVSLNRVDDFNRFNILDNIVVKLTRYCQNFDKGGHQDSIRDMTVYGAMLEELDADNSKKG